LLQLVCNFVLSEDSLATVEYAVMLALVLVACVNIVATLGPSMSSTFNSVIAVGASS